MGNITRNLSRYEFACRCGCGFDTMDVETVEIVQELCDHFKTKVRVHSGARCKVYNSLINGAPKSQHMLGRAMDISLDGVSPETVYKYLTKEYPHMYGFGLYNTFVHVDTRTQGPARW